jgi:hypothetical protein
LVSAECACSVFLNARAVAAFNRHRPCHGRDALNLSRMG